MLRKGDPYCSVAECKRSQEPQTPCRCSYPRGVCTQGLLCSSSVGLLWFLHVFAEGLYNILPKNKTTLEDLGRALQIVV